VTMPPDARPIPDAGPGFYVDGRGDLHIDARELCVRLGLMPTDANQDRVARDAARMLAEMAPGGVVEIREHPG
jgi:hypothetical protein